MSTKNKTANKTDYRVYYSFMNPQMSGPIALIETVDLGSRAALVSWAVELDRDLMSESIVVTLNGKPAKLTSIMASIEKEKERARKAFEKEVKTNRATQENAREAAQAAFSRVADQFTDVEREAFNGYLELLGLSNFQLS